MKPLIPDVNETFSETSAGKKNSPETPPCISESDARAMVRLVAEVAAFNAEHATAKHHLMEGLMKMIGADCWVWALAYLRINKPPAYVSISHGGFTEERFLKLLKASDHPDMELLMAPFVQELMTQKSQVTRLRQQIDPTGIFMSTAVYPLWLEADIAPLILSAQPLNDECVSLVGFYRRANQPLFNERENRIAHIMLTEVSWLHSTGWPQDFGADVPTLSPSRRLVLNLLLEGNSRKMVADQLNLSIHTVGDYVKDIYRTFGVQSHAELMLRFTRGDLNDRKAIGLKRNGGSLDSRTSAVQGGGKRRVTGSIRMSRG